MRLPTLLGAVCTLLLCGLLFLLSSEHSFLHALPADADLKCPLPFCEPGLSLDDALKNLDTRLLTFEFVLERDRKHWQALNTTEQAELKGAATYLANNSPYNRAAMELPRLILQALGAVDFERNHAAAVEDVPAGLSAEETELLRGYADDQMERAMSLLSMLRTHVALLDEIGAPDLPSDGGYLASLSPMSGPQFPAWESLAREADPISCAVSNLKQVRGLADAMDQVTKDSIEQSADLLGQHMDWDFKGHLIIDRDLLIVMGHDAEQMELLLLKGDDSEASTGQADLRYLIGRLTGLISDYVALYC